ncbi:hypothetical protein JTB14_016081 [Gonioctena quinquepunctata]|nr:hypothetical protein JTB14_016081 [Gonioctena quinquepunctata]
MIGEGIMVAPYEKWKKNRKLVAMSFQQEILDRFVKIFSRKNKIMLEQLKEYSGKGDFDVYPTIARCTLDTICAAIMGVEVNSQTIEAEYPKWVERILDVMLLKCAFSEGHSLTLFNLLPIGRECAKIVKKLNDFTEKIVKRRKILLQEKMRKRRIAPDEDSDEDFMKRKIFVDHMLEVIKEGKTDYTEKEIRDELNLFVIAGAYTIGSTNGFLLMMLGIHQDMQDKMYEK